MKRRDFIRGSLAAGGLAACSHLLSPLSANAAELRDLHLIFVHLRGGADIGFQMIQPDLDSPLSLPLNRARPTIYDININNNRLLGTGYGSHTNFGILRTIDSTGQLAIVQRVGLQGLIPSHMPAEMAWLMGNPIATSSQGIGFLQRAGLTHGLNAPHIVDLTSTYPTASKYGFAPLAFYQLPQLNSLDGNQDAVVLQREGNFRRNIYFESLRKSGSNFNTDMDEVQGKMSLVGSQYDNRALANATAIPAQYSGDRAGTFFRDAEKMIRYCRAANSNWTGGAKILFGTIDGAWDSHMNQGGTNVPLATSISSLNAAITRFRTNMLNGAHWQRTAIVLFTEFGRAVPENLQRGTGHGLANTVLVMGGAVRGGVYGSMPDVAQVEDKAGIIQPDFSWTEVLGDLLAGVGFDSSLIWPGYGRRGLGLLA